VRTDERGAHLVDFHSALECLTEDLWTSDQWADRFVRDGTGAKVPHTEAFVPTPPGQPYTLHSDSTADLHLCVGLGKGGRGTPTAKLVVTVANQARPQSLPNSILMSTMPCIRDDNAGLHEMDRGLRNFNGRSREAWRWAVLSGMCSSFGRATWRFCQLLLAMRGPRRGSRVCFAPL